MAENKKSKSVFDTRKLSEIYEEIRHVYQSDNRPWVLGLSGGKDSTTCLQLVWYALSELPEDKRTKPIYIISSNTLVESPILLKQVGKIHKLINEAAKEQKLPFTAQHVYPEVSDTFWVNLLGKGYPAPQNTFRWCTERLKIKPADKFILDKVDKFGEVVLLLGVRSAESNTRAQVMSLYKIKGSLLSRHSRFPQTYVYTPIENFTVDDVWTYLLQKKSPWGADNRELLALYTDKTSGECPLVVDKTTPSCGGSRFGCWTCTVVSQDKTMKALINNGETWMQPLLDIRNFLFETTNPEKKAEVRDFRGRSGKVRFKSDGSGGISRGPYKLSFCKELLMKLLEAQKRIEKEDPNTDFQIILPEELYEIRRLWTTERGDWEDSIPRLYQDVMGRELNWTYEDGVIFSDTENNMLKQICQKHEIPTEMVMKLIDVERQIQGMTRRASAQTRIDKILRQEWRTEEEVLGVVPKNNNKLNILQ